MTHHKSFILYKNTNINQPTYFHNAQEKREGRGGRLSGENHCLNIYNHVNILECNISLFSSSRTGHVGWYNYHLPDLDYSLQGPSHFILHTPLKRVYQDSNPDQFNENTCSHPTNNRTRDLVVKTINHHILY
jgi:hypothetical protein